MERFVTCLRPPVPYSPDPGHRSVQSPNPNPQTLCYVKHQLYMADVRQLRLPYQVEEIGVAGQGLPESPAYAWQGGVLMRAQFSVPWERVARSPVS